MSAQDLSQFVWRKSSLSGNGPDCVEVASLNASRFGVRDSKDRSGPALIFTSAGWRAFIGSIKSGEFDDPAI
ncbi:DUF397 domain-containing protein [Streptosporangium sp. NPDC050855]|uniref:DUF397 domain-containing protein n=1 Tax=Streptosporangium sp. NPDC050855 TaxID=3366194 RepID=UPI00378AFE59